MRIGDVYHYEPRNGERNCRERIAVVVPGFDGTSALVDTFWAILADDLTDAPRWSFLSTAHQLDEVEIASISLQFNLNDFTSVHPDAETDVYEAGDVVCVSAQGGHIKHYFLRDGAERSNRVIVKNQRAHVLQTSQAVARAQLAHQHAVEQLAMMTALVESGEQL